jgi:hydroxymethylpyrimidine/phosphomethylpyrimidine kinase
MADPGRTPRVLSIAGSDSGGGAGIQADLKAFARCGVHGMTAITAVTWQNTVAVTGVTPIPPAAIVGQVRAVAEDIGVDAVKVGMLGSAETIAAVREALGLLSGAPLVLDPVMVAESGTALLAPDAREELVALLPAATVITPNVLEARALLASAGAEPRTGEPPAGLAEALGALGVAHVVVTGGHTEGDEAVDTYWDGRHAVEIPGPRYGSGATHGSGCTHSSALAAHLALGLEPLEAAVAARQVAAEAVRDGLADVGAGAGPVDALGITGRRAARRPASGAQTPLA